jgi:protein MpaA
VALSPGSGPASEPETQALLQLIQTLNPQTILSLHGRLGCIDDPNQTVLGRWLAQTLELPLVTDIGYPTPGSLGTWAQEQGKSLITLEFPDGSISALDRQITPHLCTLLTNAPC